MTPAAARCHRVGMHEAIKGRNFLKVLTDSVVLVEPPALFRQDLKFYSSSAVGAFTCFFDGQVFGCASIGRYCSFAGGVRIGNYEHPTGWLSTNAFQYNAERFAFSDTADAVSVPAEDRAGHAFRGTPPTIGNDVWVGSNVTILRDVVIGDGAVIAASAVVTKDVPPYAMVAGVPAKVIRYRFDDETIRELLELAWWRFSPNQLSGVPFDDIGSAIAEVRRRIDEGMEPYEPEAIEVTKPPPRPKAPPKPRQPQPEPATRQRLRRRLGTARRSGQP